MINQVDPMDEVDDMDMLNAKDRQEYEEWVATMVENHRRAIVKNKSFNNPRSPKLNGK